MNIFRIAPLLICLCLIQSIDAQHVLSRVTFPIDEHQTIRDLARVGIDLSHGHHNHRDAFTTEIQDFELARFKKEGIRFTVDIEDISVLRHQQKAENRGGGLLECQDHSYDEVVPKNFEFGASGGYMSMSEVMDNLDVMAFLYPNLISTRQPIGTFKTWQNRSIFWVRISDNANVDENEPEMLYTGLHHARELITVSQTIYYMWYLLENYDKDPVVKQILNNTELYFVPVLNPDGLQYNIDGYDPVNDVFTRNHRKNMRDNDGNGVFDPSIDGVDLNRNYGYEWGYDDLGSSPFEGSDTYRGPYPFSEPETQAMEYFCKTHDFKLALNFHGYGDLLIYPWGYNDTHTNDSILYNNYGELLTKRNGFVYGLGGETVGYPSNGDSDDWMYGEENIISFTPEIGNEDDGFYPLQERIIELCQSTIQMNLLSARLINSLVQITDESPDYVQPGDNTLDLEFNRFGFLDGEVQISFNSLSPQLTNVPAPIFLNLEKFLPHERHLSFTISDNLPFGAEVKLEIVCQQGEYSFRDTLTKVRGDFSELISDKGDLSNWNKQEGPAWGVTTAEFKSGPVSITDSPLGNYAPDSHESIVLRSMVDLHEATSAYAQFWARWEVEDFYDYVVFQASTDGNNWENLCGEQSRLGSIFQIYEEPLYDGKQDTWVLETVDLSNYIGQNVSLRFLLISDGFLHKDGFYFDDFKVIMIDQDNVATSDVEQSAFAFYPNPALDEITIVTPALHNPSIRMYNSLGQPVFQKEIPSGVQNTQVHVEAWPAGLYHTVIYSNQTPVRFETICVTH